MDYLHRFILINIGEAGRHSDGGVLSNSEFGKALENGSLSIAGPCPLPGSTNSFPYVIVGDEGFPLRMNMLRPYPGRNLPGKNTSYELSTDNTHVYFLPLYFL